MAQPHHKLFCYFWECFTILVYTDVQYRNALGIRNSRGKAYEVLS